MYAKFEDGQRRGFQVSNRAQGRLGETRNGCPRVAELVRNEAINDGAFRPMTRTNGRGLNGVSQIANGRLKNALGRGWETSGYQEGRETGNRTWIDDAILEVPGKVHPSCADGRSDLSDLKARQALFPWEITRSSCSCSYQSSPLPSTPL